MILSDNEQACPCGSENPYIECCAPFISGHRPAPTAEALMRSRFTAFAIGAIDYLIDSLVPERRGANEARMLSQELRLTEWLRLEILDVQAGRETDSEGQVEFNAYFRAPETEGCLHERSNFRKENGHWYYVDGEVSLS